QRPAYDVPASLKGVPIKDLKVSDHIVALTQSGEVVVWGRTVENELPLPVELQQGGKARAIGVDGSVSFAVLANGQIITWGDGLNWWGAKIERAKDATHTWQICDSYWVAIVFIQPGQPVQKYQIYAKEASRNDYLDKTFSRYQPLKLTTTADAMVMIATSSK
ncbi:MAG: hypothetical protein Q8M07_12370, partial [Prosthecobacter sp.]|nr:hypothetical protein [Prosthecobacter sp.]